MLIDDWIEKVLQKIYKSILQLDSNIRKIFDNSICLIRSRSLMPKYT